MGQTAVFRAAGAKSNATTAANTIAAPAGIAPKDLEVLVASTIAGGSLAITNDGGGPWTAVGSPVDVAGGEKLYVWMRIRQAGDGDPQITPGSDHSIGTRLCWMGGTFDETTPIEIVVSGSEATSDTSFSFAPGSSTTVDNCLVICVSTSGVDSTTAQVPVCTNASLTGLVSRFNGETSNGGGGGFGVTEGVKASAGAVGTFACTYTSASPKAYLSFAIRPYVPASFPGSLAVLDDFNRASLGAAWVAPAFGAANSGQISGSSQLASSGTNGTCCKTDAVVPNPFDAYIEIPTLPASGNLSWDFLCDGSSSTVNCYQLKVTPSSSTWTISKLVSGAATALGSTLTQAVAAGDAIGLRFNGGYIEAWIRHSGVWSFVGSRYDSTYSAAGYFGFSIPDSTIRLDNLYVTASGQSAAIGRVTGVGVAQGVSRSKARSLGIVTGFGLARSIVRVRSRALGRVTGSGTVRSIARGRSRALGLVTGLGVAQPIGRSKSRALGLATGSGAARAIARGRSCAIGLVTGLGFTQSIGRSKSRSLGLVFGLGAAQAFSRSKSRAVGLVTGVGVARSIANLAGVVVPIGRVVGLGFTHNIARRKDAPIRIVFGFGAAQTFGRAKARAVGLVTGAGTALGIVRPRAWSSLPVSLPSRYSSLELPDDSESSEL